MRHPRAIAAAAVCLAAHAHAQVTDPSFETTQPLQLVPDAFGVWGLDRASTSTGAGGIVPFHGARMLSIDGTTPVCNSPDNGASGDVGQLFPFPPGVGPGSLYRASVRVNRVGGAESDSEFVLVLGAYSGVPATFPIGCASARPALDTARTELISDADPGTWELIEAELTVPDDAEFLWIAMSIRENVNDSDAPPYLGHFADDVRVSFDAAGCTDADLADPFGTLNFNDVIAFLTAFAAMDPSADLAPSFGVLDFNDVIAYLTLFAQGCP